MDVRGQLRPPTSVDMGKESPVPTGWTSGLIFEKNTP